MTVAAVPDFEVEGGRTLHEVVESGLVLPAGNNLTLTNNSTTADVGVHDAVLLYLT